MAAKSSPSRFIRAGWRPRSTRATAGAAPQSYSGRGSRPAVNNRRVGGNRTMLTEVARALLSSATLGVLVAGPARAQGYPFSQRGSVTQMVAFTEISVTYGRPVARGRALFGALVPWDSVWHPGADSATRITFTRAVIVEGMPLPAGEYSLWLIPRESAPWTVIFSRAAHVFHKPYPGARFEVMR